MRLMLLLLVFFFASQTMAADTLPASLKQALQAENVPLESVSVYVKRVDATQPSLSFQADTPRNPASVMKLVTAYAALDLLGPSYRWKTQFLALNKPEQGKLNGDLWVKGSGDPSISTQSLSEVASELRQKFNLEEICCGLSLDVSAYPAQNFDAATFDGKPYRAYNAPAEALMVNQQAMRLQFVAGEKVQVIAYPDWRGLVKKVDVKAVAGECNDWKSGLQINREGQTLHIRGSYPTTCGDKYLDVNWQHGADYFANVFYSAWEQAGGRWAKSDSPQFKLAAIPSSAVLLTEHTSPTLAEVVRDMNKTSNNVIARALYLNLSYLEEANQPASTLKSEQVVKRWLQSKRWSFDELVLENGAGLSRQERISAGHLGLLLDDAFHSPVMPELTASLPIYGLDGSLTRRKESLLFGRAHLKTGSLEGVRAIAGYFLDAKGRYWSVVFMANGAKAGDTKSAQDALLTWVYQQE